MQHWGAMFVIGGPDQFIHERQLRRIAREGLLLNPDGSPYTPFLSLGVTTDNPGFGMTVDWSEVYRWCDEHLPIWYSQSPFTGAWRRYFSFDSEADAVAFTLRFS